VQYPVPFPELVDRAATRALATGNVTIFTVVEATPQCHGMIVAMQ